MNAIYAQPTVADAGTVVTRTLGIPNLVSLEPNRGFRNVGSDTASVLESADGKVIGANSSFSLLSRSNE
jgi:hypothetical protein